MPSGLVSELGNAGELFRIAKQAVGRPPHGARLFERSHRSIDFRATGAKKLRQLALGKAELEPSTASITEIASDSTPANRSQTTHGSRRERVIGLITLPNGSASNLSLDSVRYANP